MFKKIQFHQTWVINLTRKIREKMLLCWPRGETPDGRIFSSLKFRVEVNKMIRKDANIWRDASWMIWMHLMLYSTCIYDTQHCVKPHLTFYRCICVVSKRRLMYMLTMIYVLLHVSWNIFVIFIFIFEFGICHIHHTFVICSIIVRYFIYIRWSLQYI